MSLPVASLLYHALLEVYLDACDVKEELSYSQIHKIDECGRVDLQLWRTILTVIFLRKTIKRLMNQ